MDGREMSGGQVATGRRCACGAFSDGEPRGDAGGSRARPGPAHDADRFVEDQLFEEDVRAVVAILRPHRRERLMGWTEYRTGGAHFRATVSWEPSFERGPQTAAERRLRVPRLTDVLESILVGSVRDLDGLSAAEEFGIYRDVVRELYRRLDAVENRYQ
jgi:hypothetical protein